MLGCADGDGRFVDDDEGMLHVFADGGGDAGDLCQVGIAVRSCRCVDRDEADGSRGDRFGIVGGEMEPTSLDVAADHLFQASFVDRDDSFIEFVDLILVDI